MNTINCPPDSFAMKVRAILIVFFLVSAVSIPVFLAQKSSGSKSSTEKRTEPFGGDFKTLDPEQQKLVVDVLQHYARTVQKTVDPEAVYNETRLSVRTTFDAVTHALGKTRLTGSDGKSMGTALSLIETLEDVAGEVPKARGDRQFRIYVYLKPNVVRTLEASQEFEREKDNTHYHLGFPICFRLLGGPPSIQFSISRDEKRADIDVDYRSSSFPAALVNGHLTAGNSDVRVGDNLERHDGRWTGLSGWWRNLFGWSFQSPTAASEDTIRSQMEIPVNPRIRAKEGLDSSVNDFLTSWIIEQKPNLAAAYFSRRSFACVENIARGRGKPFEPGLVKPMLMMSMTSFNKKVGRISRIGEVLENVKPWNPRLKSVDNRYESEFLLFAVPDDIAAAQECAAQDAAEPISTDKKPSTKYGKYFGSAFRLKAGDRKGSAILFMWSKEDEYWKIVALKIVDQADPKLVTTTTAVTLPKAPAMPRVKGDPRLVEAVQQFVSAWFVKEDYDTVLSFLSPRSYVCLENSGDPAKRGLGPEKAREAVRDGIEKTAQAIGKKVKLEEAIHSVQPQHELLKLVTHSHEAAFSLASMPDGMAEDNLCRKTVKGKKETATPLDDPSNKVYGHYYVSSFALAIGDDEPAAFYCLWGMEDRNWKILAWRIVSD